VTPAVVDTPTGAGALPTDLDLEVGTYVLSGYDLFDMGNASSCNTVGPVNTTLTVTSSSSGGGLVNASIEGATLFGDGTSSTFGASVFAMGSVLQITDTCPDTALTDVSWGTSGGAGTSKALTLFVESTGATPVTPLNTGCTAIATYVLQ
jgi:hypothetical protein